MLIRVLVRSMSIIVFFNIHVVSKMTALELRYDSTDDEIPLFQRHNYNHPYSDCTPAKRQETRPQSRRERFYKKIKESHQKSQSDIPTHVDQHQHSTEISHKERSEAPRQKEPKDVPRVVQEDPFQPRYQSLAVHVKPQTTQIHPRHKNVSWLDQMFKSKLFKNSKSIESLSSKQPLHIPYAQQVYYIITLHIFIINILY